MNYLAAITSGILLVMSQPTVQASETNLFDRSSLNSESYLLLADRDNRQDRRDERGRSDERQDRRDCRQDEGRVGKDKRECKQEEVRDGVRGHQDDD